MSNTLEARKLVQSFSSKIDISDLDIHLLKQKLTDLKQLPLTRKHFYENRSDYYEVKNTKQPYLYYVSTRMVDFLTDKRISPLVSTADYTQNILRTRNKLGYLEYDQSVKSVNKSEIFISLVHVIGTSFQKSEFGDIGRLNIAKPIRILSKILCYRLDYKNPDYEKVIKGMTKNTKRMCIEYLDILLSYVEPVLHKDYFKVLNTLVKKLKFETDLNTLITMGGFDYE